MGRSGPLDHPELREVEHLLDTRDVAEAQRLLATLGNRADLADGVAYLTTRLLYARRRLDLKGVADRLRDLVARAPGFEEAAALLARAEAGRMSSHPPRPESSPRAPSSRPPHGATKPTPPPATPKTGTQPSVHPPAHGLDQPLLHSSPKSGSQPSFRQVSSRAPKRPPSSSLPPATPRVSTSPGPPRTLTPPTEASAGSSSIPPTVPASPKVPHARGTGRDSGPPMPPLVEHQLPRQYTPVTGFDAFAGTRAHAAAPEQPPRTHLPNIPRAPALPQFHDNSAPPSYAPNRVADQEAEALRSKSVLPRDAGRYSEAPGAAEVMLKPDSRRPSRPPRSPASAPPGADGRARETVPQTPDRIRPAMPSRGSSALPTLFEIASWIDAGRHRDAIAAINRAGPGAGAEYAVLRARALAGAGYADQAVDALEKLERAPLLDPELRASCARLFVELGDPAHALRIAKQALEADPDRPIIRLTFALAAVRASRRSPDEALLVRADRTLERLSGREGPMPALYQSLKACIEAGSGDPERAISIAQRALGLDPKSADALAAVAEASARLGRVHDARQAWTRLHEVSADEAEALATALSHLGMTLGAGARPSQPPPHEPPLWLPVETDLASGKRAGALRAVEQAASDAVRRMAKSASGSGLTATATVAASFLTTAPVFSSFAPFDVSLWSLRRLEAALDVLYGGEGRPQLPTDDTSLVLLLGSYVGETLRTIHGGHWEGRVTDVDSARVVLRQHEWSPFRIVRARLRDGRRAAIGDALHAAFAAAGAEHWRARTPNPVAPPVPWAPHAWPRPSQVGVLGRSLPKSPIGKYCEDFAEGSLDRTIASLIALDTYLDLIAPRDAPTDADSAWTRRISVLTGGYVGETLRELAGGEWIYGVDSASDANGYKLLLRGTVEALPVAHVLERVIGERSSSLVDYAKTLLRRAGRA